MILFVRAKDGKIDHISLHRAGVDYEPTYNKKDKAYHSEFGVFDIAIDDDGETVVAVLNGQEPDEVSKVNDLWRFVFGYERIVSERSLGVSVSDGIATGERIGG